MEPTGGFTYFLGQINFQDNKKVLLRERKRHTARRVASTRYTAPIGVPLPSWDLTWTGGTPAGVPLPRQGVPGVPLPAMVDKVKILPSVILRMRAVMRIH